MTTDAFPSAPATAPAIPVPPSRHPLARPLLLLGGALLVLHPLLFLAGAATSPSQESDAMGDYIASLARDPFLSGVSANLFHYSWVAATFGALACLTLVRTRRGAVLTLVGGLAAALGSVQFSGLLYADWVLVSAGTVLAPDQALAVVEDFHAAPSIAVWLLSAKVLGLLGFPLLFAGLARAGVLPRWTVPLSLLPLVGLGVVGGPAGLALAAACYAPYYLAGWRLVQRSRLD